MRLIKTLAGPVAGISMFGLAANSAVADEMTGVWQTDVVSITGAVHTGDNGPMKQLYQRYGVTKDENDHFVAFYSDVISTTWTSEAVTWETHGTYHFSAEDKIFYHTTGFVDLATGEWFWNVREITGGTGIFEAVTTGVGLGGEPAIDQPGDFDGAGGCYNPADDPEGFPNIVVCRATVSITY